MGPTIYQIAYVAMCIAGLLAFTVTVAWAAHRTSDLPRREPAREAAGRPLPAHP